MRAVRAASGTGLRRFWIVASLVGLTAGCDILLGDGDESLVPLVELMERQALLVEPPRVEALARYYCDEVLEASLCLALGPPPPAEELKFRFRLDFLLRNPNDVPVPATELLVGLDLFPGRAFGDLASVCTTLCEADATRCPIPAGAPCSLAAGERDPVEGFFEGAARGALTLATELVNGQPPEAALGGLELPAGGDLEMTVTFGIGVDPMLDILSNTAGDYVGEILRGGATSLEIPYSTAGRLWFSVPFLGRVSAPFGPLGSAEDPLLWEVF